MDSVPVEPHKLDTFLSQKQERNKKKLKYKVGTQMTRSQKVPIFFVCMYDILTCVFCAWLSVSVFTCLCVHACFVRVGFGTHASLFITTWSNVTKKIPLGGPPPVN